MEINNNASRAEVTTLGQFELGTWTVQTFAVCSSVDSLGVTDDLLLFYLTRVPFPVNSTQKYDIFSKKSSRESFHNFLEAQRYRVFHILCSACPAVIIIILDSRECRFNRVLTHLLTLRAVYTAIKNIPLLWIQKIHSLSAQES
jgi:hypothetical protein